MLTENWSCDFWKNISIQFLTKYWKYSRNYLFFLEKKYQLRFWSFFGLFMEFCWSFGIFCGIFLKYLLEYYSRFYSNKSQTLYHEYTWNIPSVKKYTWNILFIHEIIPEIYLVFGGPQTSDYLVLLYTGTWSKWEKIQ